MKLIEIVKTTESAGLANSLYIHADGTLMLRAETIPSFSDACAIPYLVFCCSLGCDGETAQWSDARIRSNLAEAAKHPDAVARRELMARIEAKNAQT